MTASLRLAITADQHWGHGRGHDENRLLVEFLRGQPPDVLILAGDIGTGAHFAECLAQFDTLSCRKALIPGNHDIWVSQSAPDYDSLALYREVLPRTAAAHGFVYLDHGPLLLPEAGLALVGSINWYDYSWAQDSLRRLFPAEEERLHSKRFTRGRHNDFNFVRWPLDDVRFTAQVVQASEQQLDSALAQVARAIVVTHHPPIYEMSFPRTEPPTDLDGLLWDAFGGNQAMEDVLARRAARIPFAFCGHTHRAREIVWRGIRGYNVGSDYPYKRLLLLDWPAGTVTVHEFGERSY
jgi:predicted phosphohydrolase